MSSVQFHCGRYGPQTLREINTHTADITAAWKRINVSTDCYGRDFRLMFPPLLPFGRTQTLYIPIKPIHHYADLQYVRHINCNNLRTFRNNVNPENERARHTHARTHARDT